MTVARQFGENLRAVRRQAGLSQEGSAFAPPSIELRSGCWSGALACRESTRWSSSPRPSASGSTARCWRASPGTPEAEGPRWERSGFRRRRADAEETTTHPATTNLNQPVSKSNGRDPKATNQRPGSPKQQGDVQRRLLHAPQHHHPTARHTGNPPGSCLERALSPSGAAADFGTAFAVRRPPLWPPGGLAGTVDFESDPMHLALLPDRWGAEEMRDEDHIEIERLLSPEDVARVCGLSRRAVYRAIARGELRAARLCHRLRVQQAELERWIAEQTQGASPSPRQVRRRTAGADGGLRVLLDESGEG